MSHPAATTPYSPFALWADGLQAQGVEGQKLGEAAEAALRHWNERPSVVLAANDEDDFSYVSVPPNRTFYVKTRYVCHGKGAPLPFELDDE